MLKLLRFQGFLCFLSVAFINAFVDLGHKILVQNTLFKVYQGPEQVWLTALVNALILLPFIMTLSPAGYLSDRFCKVHIMRISAAIAVVLTGIITWSYYQGWFELAFAMTFLLALQSALYSPAKYGFIRQLVGKDHLSEANGWVQSVTMVAILSGIVVFSLAFETLLVGTLTDHSSTILTTIAPLGWLLVGFSLFELWLAMRLPEKQGEMAEQSSFTLSSYLKGQQLRENLRLLTSHWQIITSVLGLALFWSISQVMLAVFPAYAEIHLQESNTFILQGIMALAGVGIMLGSWSAGVISKGHINVGLIPLGAVGVAIGLVLLTLADSALSMSFIFLLVGFSGAWLVVPLNALIQFNAPEESSGRILAGNNFVQNVAMLLFLGVTILIALLNIDPVWLLVGLAIVSILGAIQAIRMLPQAFIRLLLSMLIRRKYRLEVLGFENLPAAGQGTLLLGNHISWLDWAVIQLSCPHHVYFVMDKTIYERWYLNWFFRLYEVIPISGSSSRSALKRITELLNQGETVCLFPEGSISHNGQLGEFRKGFERACEEASGVIVPFYMRGLWGSRLSRSTRQMHKLRRDGLQRDVVIAFGEPLDIHATASEVKQAVFELSIHTWEAHTKTLPTVPAAFIATAKRCAPDLAICDSTGGEVNYRKLLMATLLFCRHIKQLPGDRVGILMPTNAAGMIANMAALMAGKTVVNLNYTASQESMMAAVEQANIQSIVTAELFVTRLKLKEIDIQPLLAKAQVIYMDKLRTEFTTAEKIKALLTSFLPTFYLQWLYGGGQDTESTAAILFSSGSEGQPKGVMLSHRNIVGNLKQTADVLNVREDDRFMATLPLFHAFGLTATCFLPLIEGIPVVTHPDPTDAKNIGKAVAKYRATLICATSTFLRLYTRNSKLHPLMFQSLRLAVAGAERLDPAVRQGFEAKFHVPIYEGYGCTETTPVAGVNLPDHLDNEWWTVQRGNKNGTIGMALPGSTFRIVDPTTLEKLPTGEAGLILIGGTQIMQGYLNQPEKTAEVIVTLDRLRWYKTGDKGYLDEDGFLTIVDRYSRFAKLGGEMVSLGQVEALVREKLQQPELPLVAVNLPDAKKGERVVLLAQTELTADEIRQQLIAAAMPPLLLPSEVKTVSEIPLLGSGKTDFAAAKRVALGE